MRPQQHSRLMLSNAFIVALPFAAHADPYWLIFTGDTASTYEQACKKGYDYLVDNAPESETLNYRGVYFYRWGPGDILRQVYCLWSKYPNKTPNALSNLHFAATRDGDSICIWADQVLDPVQGSCVRVGNDARNWGAPAAGSCVNNPINVGAGIKFMATTDVVGAGAGSLKFERFYSSGGSLQQAIGAHWSGSYLQKLAIGSDWVQASRPDGSVWRFSRGADGQWASPSYPRATLIEPTTGNSQWQLVLGNEQTESYDEAGYLQSITERGNSQYLSYINGTRPTQVVAANGQTLTFTWDSYLNRIGSITLNNAQTWTYSYGLSGNLTSVQNPGGTLTRYHYENTQYPHALTGITDERGVRYATYSYDDQGRAVSTSHALDTEKAIVTYDSALERTVTNSRGDSVSYTMTVQNGVPLPSNVTGAGCSSCGM